jgi:hypothetical protein
MTPDAAATLRTRAQRQLSADRCFVHVTAKQVYELCAAYLDAVDRLERVHALAEAGLCQWADNHRDKERVALGEIERLSKTVP